MPPVAGRCEYAGRVSNEKSVSVVLLALLTACSQRAPTPAPVVGSESPAVEAPKPSSAAELVAAAIPDNAELVLLEATPELAGALDRAPECQALAKSLGPGFTAYDYRHMSTQLVAGTTDRAVLERCLTEAPEEWRKRQAIADGATTMLYDANDNTEYLFWSASYVGMAPEKSAFTKPVAGPQKVTRYRRMIGKPFAVSTTMLGPPVFEQPMNLLALLDSYELPFEWGRRVSGTLELEFASPADATEAAARIASGRLGAITDPELVAAIKALPFTVDGRTLRATLKDFTFRLDLLRDAVKW